MVSLRTRKCFPTTGRKRSSRSRCLILAPLARCVFVPRCSQLEKAKCFQERNERYGQNPPTNNAAGAHNKPHRSLNYEARIARGSHEPSLSSCLLLQVQHMSSSRFCPLHTSHSNERGGGGFPAPNSPGLNPGSVCPMYLVRPISQIGERVTIPKTKLLCIVKKKLEIRYVRAEGKASYTRRSTIRAELARKKKEKVDGPKTTTRGYI